MLTPIPGQVDLSLDLGGQVLDFVKGLGVEFGFERSLRLAPSQVQGDRFLITIAGSDLVQRLPPVAFLNWLRLPAPLTVAALRLIRTSTHIHIGVEEDPTSPVLKLYFEKTSGHQRHQAPTDWLIHNVDRTARTLHLSCKWNPNIANRWVLTNYTEPSSYDSIRAQIRDRIGSSESAVVDFVDAVLDLDDVAEKLADCCYLEVAEVGNERCSFDLNLYPANVRIATIEPALCALANRFDLPSSVQEQLVRALENETLGHIAGGFHRNGAPFVTIYHGVSNERRV